MNTQLPNKLHWQANIDGLGVVSDYDDINQSLGIIVTTQKGSDPLRPQFGCDIQHYLDMPIQLATAHIVREVFEAVSDPQFGEPRVSLKKVIVEPSDISQLHIKLQCVLADGVAAQFEVQI